MTNLAMWWYCVVWGVANFYALAYVHAFSRWRKTLKVEIPAAKAAARLKARAKTQARLKAH